ncbi:MAG: histidine--tRNA ligase [Devosiaceae bacterium]|nr:histidine--tRNA ligase [Devosiaceae bacterium]
MMAKNKKPQKVKARLIRGFNDRSSSDIRATDEMMDKIRSVFELYGFDPIETPFLEYTDALGKFLPDSDRPNEGVFSLQDEDEQWLSMRYDLTAPLARHVAQNFNQINMPYRTFRSGWVFRNEKPGPGRFRQFMQFDADIVGAPSVSADAEMCMMMADTMEALGIKRGDYVIRVNNRKVLDGVLQAIGVTEEGQKLSVLRAIDKLDKFGVEGVRLLLGEGRKDESGDFTKGAGLDRAQCSAVLKVVGSGAIPKLKEVLDQVTLDTGGVPDEWGGMGHLLYDDAVFEITEELEPLLNSAGYSDRIKIDPSCVRGLEYYTGMVYEAELLFDVTNEKGDNVVFGSVGGGGRYDGLIKRFTGQAVPATGFSIGVSRLMSALKNLNRLDENAMPAPVVVCVMDKSRISEYQKMVGELRSAGIRAEMYQGNPKNFGKQLQYADRRNSPAAIIDGSDEFEKEIIQIKDLVAGKQASKNIKDNETWKEQRPGQFECKRDDLVEKISALPAIKAWLNSNG